MKEFEFIKKLFQCFFDWPGKCAAGEELSASLANIAFSFGDSEKSNYFLAKKADKLIIKYETPTIAQWEIGDYLSKGKIATIKKGRVVSQYLNTYEVAFRAAEICKKLNIKKILILAHPHHAWRCKKTLEKLGLSVGVIDTSGCPYDSSSNQIWTRSRALFIPREILARLMYLVKGYI